MEKTEVMIEQSAFGRMLPPIAEKEKKKIPLPKARWVKEGLLCCIGFLWGNTSVFTILNPLGLAYASAFLLEGVGFYLAAASVALGLLFAQANHGGKYILCLLLCAILEFTAGRRVKKSSVTYKAIWGGGATAIGGIAFAAVNGGSVFYFWVTAVESVAVFLLTFITSKGIHLIRGSMKRRILTEEELISLALIAGGAVAGSAGLIVPYVQIPLVAVLASMMILIAGWRGGAGTGAASGVLIGMFLLVSGKGDLVTLCAFSLGGLLCGGLKELGRLAAALGFLVSVVVILFYQNHDMLELTFVEGILLGIAAFICIPRRAFTFLNTYLVHEKEFHEDVYFIKMKELTESRLQQFANAFHTLSKTFHIEPAGVEVTGKRSIARVIDTIADKACHNCGLAAYCWDTEFYNTYQTTFGALSMCERRGRVSLHHLPEEFTRNCIRKEIFVDVVNRCYENFQIQNTWRHKLEECRELVGQQFSAIGQIMEELSGQLDVRGVFLESLEKEIMTVLDKRHLRVKQVSVVESRQKNGGQEVTLIFKACNGNKACTETVIPIVEKILGKPMRKAGGRAVCYCGKENLCHLHLVEENQYRLTAAVATCPKEEGGVCGDNTAYLETPGGTAIMALSDGMGTGQGAREESKSAIELLEQFMEAGFQKELAVKMINSALLLRSGEENFATLDICSVDLYSGKAEFMKIGAAAAYLLRDGRTIAIRSHTLPVGILQQIETDKNDMMLKDGDMILLMTDGVTDAIGGQEEDVAWLSKTVEEFYSSNPQDMADYILMAAQKTLNGVRKDDMTVMCGRFWQKASSF